MKTRTRTLRQSLLATAAVLILFALSTTGAAAGGRSAELGVQVGMTDVDDNVSDDAGTSFGLRGGYRFTPRFGLEGQAGRTEADDRGAKATLSTVFVNGVYSFRPEKRVEPYLLTGIGTAKLELKAPTFGLRADDTGAAFQVAAGSRFFVDRTRSVSVRVELARMHERTFSEGSDYNSLTTGVSWKLGRS